MNELNEQKMPREIETDTRYNPEQERKLVMNGNVKGKIGRTRAKEMKEFESSQYDKFQYAQL